jgi:AcrR family transcriptional regulator
MGQPNLNLTAQPAARALFPMGTGHVDPADKSARILKAALDLFVRYGIKRTSIDDIAREAGIAKGTLYLYYQSKDALFAAVAERMCAERLAMAREASAGAGPLVDRLVAILDSQIGVMCRLIAESPHIAELAESRAFAAATYDKFDRDIEVLITEVLSLDGVSGRNVPEMLTACAIGMVEICGTNEKLFRERLTALVDTLIQGLRSRMESTRETELPKHSRKTRQKPGATDAR